MESEDYEKRALRKKASLTPVFKRLCSMHVLFHCNLSITFSHIRRKSKLMINRPNWLVHFNGECIDSFNVRVPNH